MKKINFKAMSQSLTREEMRSVMAGSGGGCNSYTKCSLYANGLTYEGFCSAVSGNNTVTCYCNTDYGVYMPSSNGGWSRCWS